MLDGGFRKIVLAYDGSDGSERARELAILLARSFHATVIVVIAFRAMPRLSTPDADDIRFIHETRHLAETVVAGLEKAGVRAEPDVLEGPAAEAIINAADVHSADLIIIGSRGMGQFGGLLLGSVSDRVVHYANVPVLLAR